MTYGPDDLHATALTLLGEARGEDTAGMTAVAWVVRNRAADGRWPTAPREVVHDPMQFSTWNDAQANLGNIRRMAFATWDDPGYREARAVAAAVFSGLLDDPTGGANHYHAARITPAWADPQAETARIGDHVFYAL